MKKFRKLIAFALFICTVLSLIPPVQFARAAEVTYELDTDGIDPGAEYLIVSNSGQALNGAGSPGAGTAVTIVNGTTIYPFDNVNECLWVYEADTKGLRHENRYLGLTTITSKAPFYQDTPFPLTIGNNSWYAILSQGKYSIYCQANGNIYYLVNSTSYEATFASGTNA